MIQDVFTPEKKSTQTTIPLFKYNAFDYSSLLTWISPDLEKFTWLVFIPIVIFILVAVSNGANLTDGIDGLAAGSSAIMVLALGLFAWVSGNLIFSDYLDIMYIPNVGEVVIFVAAFIGALIGFLWFNTYPAQVFMGDVGSLALGAALAIVAIVIRHEIVLLIMGGLFVLETASVIVQVISYRFTGKRVFRMAPIHHHFELKGWAEPKVIVRFWIITVVLVTIGISSLKLR